MSRDDRLEALLLLMLGLMLGALWRWSVMVAS